MSHTNAVKSPSALVLGLALFSMFFGSGNLIFPLFLGQFAQQHWITAFGGFFVTAVGLPLLGVIAMVIYAGNYRAFFSQLGRPLGFLLTLLLLTVWIPFGSAPRCIALSYASLTTYLNVGPLWVYALCYSFFVVLVISQGARMLTILGSYLTPALLLSLFAIIAFAASSTGAAGSSHSEHAAVFGQGIVEGYNTMDLIASFFFSASIIGLLQNNENTVKQPLAVTLKLVMQAGAISAVILALVYASLLYTAAAHYPVLVDIPKEQMLAHLAKVFLGEKLGVIAAVTIFLACITTSIALVTVFAEFLASLRPGKSAYRVSLFLTSVFSFAMALTGLEGITAVTAPVLQICYPLLLLMILYVIGRYVVVGYFKHYRNVEVETASAS